MTSLKRILKLTVAAWLEHFVRRLLHNNPQVKLVAVGGSVGKTSTKLAIASVLSQKYRVEHHEGNYNDAISVPLSILGLEVPDRLFNPLTWPPVLMAASKRAKQPFNYDVILVELGTDQPGDIPHFMKHLRPNIGIVTATTPEHMLMFKTVDAVTREEFLLARHSQVAVVNADDDGIKARLSEIKHKIVTYGASGEVRFSDHSVSKTGTIATTLHLGTEVLTVQTAVVAEHSLYALAAAAAVGLELGLSKAEIAAGIEAFRPVAGRMNPLAGLNGSLIIDDSYNASPDAVLAALVALGMIAKGRAIAVLGSMNELGSYSKEGHERVGAACAHLDLLITIGRDAKDFLVPAAQKAGLDAQYIQSFNSPFEAGKYLAPLLRSGDTVLVKGSQNGVFSEETVKLLLRDPADRSKLVRQSDYWQTIKQTQFSDYE